MLNAVISEGFLTNVPHRVFQVSSSLT